MTSGTLAVGTDLAPLGTRAGVGRRVERVLAPDDERTQLAAAFLRDDDAQNADHDEQEDEGPAAP